MKKKAIIFVIFFMAVVYAAVFAQTTIATTIDLRTDGLYNKTYLNDYEALYPGEFKIFNGRALADPGFILGVELKYDGPGNKYGGKLWLPLVNENDPARGIKAGAYCAWIRFGPNVLDSDLPLFRVYAGNDDLMGLTDQFRYNVFYEWYFLKPDSLRLTSFGVILPYNAKASGNLAAQYTITDTNNMGLKPNGLKPEMGLKGVNVMTDINIGPFTLSLSNLGNFFYQSKPDKNSEEMDIDFGVRAGLANVGGVTVEAIYKQSGTIRENTAQNIKTTKTEHTTGIYAGLNPLADLGLGLGYSAYFNTEQRNDNIIYSHPFYHAVDLRIRYIGIPNTTLTFNNNFSFSIVSGDNDNNTVIYGIPFDGIRISNLEKEQKQDYFVYTGAIHAAYSINGNLTADLQTAMHAGRVRNEGSSVRETFSKNLYSAYVGASYRFDYHVSIRGGFSMKLTMDELTATDSAREYNGGILEWGFPLAIRLFF
ncbi:MAG: hypothetical protein LBH43_17365 [Treponema sp.]|jgi:hypothetical protein|nr:hypothetical protein [Treponema sp.]